MNYLDWAATAIPDPAVLEESQEIALNYYGNPSSYHKPGKKARDKVTETRQRCASLLGVKPEQIIFTSGGTEGNNLVFGSLLRKKKSFSLIISGIEHPSGYDPAFLLKEKGGIIKTVNAAEDGIVDPRRFAELIDKDTALISVMLVNNETGAIQPIAEIADHIRKKEKEYRTRIHFHCDMVQALAKIPVDMNQLDIDSASFSAHKFRGPRGTGFLYLRKEKDFYTAGGEQEMGFRPGTENLPGIWGMSRTMEKYIPLVPDNSIKIGALRKTLRNQIQSLEFCRLIPEKSTDLYSPYIITFFVPRIPGEILVRVLSDKGFAVSTGSACSRTSTKRTRGLEHMGISKETALSALRVSFGYTTTAEEISEFCDALRDEVPLLLSMTT